MAKGSPVDKRRKGTKRTVRLSSHGRKKSQKTKVVVIDFGTSGVYMCVDVYR